MRGRGSCANLHAKHQLKAFYTNSNSLINELLAQRRMASLTSLLTTELHIYVHCLGPWVVFTGVGNLVAVFVCMTHLLDACVLSKHSKPSEYATGRKWTTGRPTEEADSDS